MNVIRKIMILCLLAGMLMPGFGCCESGAVEHKAEKS